MKKVIPNGITTLSLLLGTVALWHYLYGNIAFGLCLNLLCIPLDGLDGYLARKFDACTKFGKVYDLIVDYLVFGLFLTAIPYRLYGPDTWIHIIMILFVGSHTARVIINASKPHASYRGMPDIFNPIVIAIVYFTVAMEFTLLVHYALCAVYMHLWFRYPRYSDYRRMRAIKGMTVSQALITMYLCCMFGLDLKNVVEEA